MLTRTALRSLTKTLPAVFFLSAGGLLAGACDVTRAPAEPQVEDLLTAVCDLAFDCCDQGEAAYYLGPYVLPDDCASRMIEASSLSGSFPINLAALAGLRQGQLTVPNLPALNEAVQAGSVVIDETALTECIDYLSTQNCNEPVEDDDEDEPVATCVPPTVSEEDSPCETSKIFIGQLTEGQDCTSAGTGLECAPGYRCGTGAGLGVFGRCVRLRQETETCVADSDCQPDLYCSPLDGTCQAPSEKGEVCVFADRNDPAPAAETLLVRCESHLSCDPLSRTCVEACEEGATCADDTDCDQTEDLVCVLGRCSDLRSENQPCAVSEHCQAGLRCGVSVQDPGEMTCQPALEDGEVCQTGRDCESGYCAADSGLCEDTADLGEACPSGLSEECGEGACAPENPSTPCTDASDCPGSGTCTYQGYPLYDSYCGTYCIELKSDGASCENEAECESGACVAGSCATPPLNLGDECESADQCESGFCNYEDTRECDTLPLSLSKPCMSGFECESRVCFEGECTRGLSEGEECSDPSEPPCDPHTTYCDAVDFEPPVCRLLRETGEACEYDGQCRGACELNHNRLLCSPSAPQGEVVCDGGDRSRMGQGGASGN